MTKDSEPCPNALNLTDDELEGINWVVEMLNNIRHNPQSVSPRHFIAAAKAAQALDKIRQYCDDAHALLDESFEIIVGLQEHVKDLHSLKDLPSLARGKIEA